MAGPSSVGGLSTREGGGPVSGDPKSRPETGGPKRGSWVAGPHDLKEVRRSA
jgi:hypothetical protein